jgi:hypothetical protein
MMQYEYCQAMDALGREEWPLVQSHLYDEGVLDALKTYVAAFEAYQDACSTYDYYTFDTSAPFEDVLAHVQEMGRLRKVCRRAEILQTRMYDVLLQMLVSG